MHKISICAFIKDEPDLEDWFSYHRSIGVDQFYILDRGSKIPVKQRLQNAHCIIVRDDIFQQEHTQMLWYEYCMREYGSQTEWMSVIDGDEYLVKKDKYFIGDSLDDYKDFGGLCVNWVIYGSNGHITHPEGSCIENFTKKKLLQLPGINKNLTDEDIKTYLIFA